MKKSPKQPPQRHTIDWLLEQSLETKVTMLTHHFEICRIVINQILEDNVVDYTGEKYSHKKPHEGRYDRWGHNLGSVKIGAQKLPIAVPRIYDNEEECNRSLESYALLKQLPEQSEAVRDAVLLGLGTRNYGRVVETLHDSFGLSKTQISERFIAESTEALREFNERRFHQHTFVALFIDGKSQQKQQIVIALGIDASGEKIPLGFIQSSTENAESIKDLLHNLIDRGLQFDKGLLVVTDGGKGVQKAIKDVFGPYAVAARCQWHKRENVVRYLPETEQDKWRARLSAAYKISDYLKAKEKLNQIKAELAVINISAVNSLEEGFEECLTLHRLGIAEQFYESFSTTNCIENLNSLITRFTKQITYWQNSDQRHRWIATALLEIEQRLRKVQNWRNLPLLQLAVGNEVQRNIQASQESGQGSSSSMKKKN